MNEAIEKLRKEKYLIYKKYSIISVLSIFIGLLSAALIAVVASLFDILYIIIPCVITVFGVVLCVAFGSKASKISKSFSDYAISEIIPKLLEAYDNADYFAGDVSNNPNGFNIDEIKKKNFSKGDYPDVLMDDLIIGEISGVKVKSCNMDIMEFRTKLRHGRITTAYSSKFDGRMYEFEFPNITIDSNLNNSIVEKLKKEYNNVYEIAIDVSENKISVGFFYYKFHLNISIKNPIEEEILKLKKEIEMPIHLLEIFNSIIDFNMNS